MGEALSVQELSAAYGNERPHTEHVTAMALKLFDGARAALRLPAADREILRLAAQLHDIGFASCPGYHARHGARLIADNGVRGFTDKQVAMAAAAVILHSGDWRRYLQHPLVTQLRSAARSLKLAAILRVADALDHAHVQDGELLSVRHVGDCIHVRVCSAVYDGNVISADHKSDLWREFLSVGIRFDCLPRPCGGPLFAGLVTGEDCVLSTARKILALQYRIMADKTAAAEVENDPEHLHDIRVALRRFRAALRLFRPHLEGSGARRLNRELRSLAVRLGPLRDHDVWLGFLRRKPVRDALAGSAEAQVYVARYTEERTVRLERLRSVLRGPETKRILRAMSYYFRAEPPFRGGAPPSQPFRPYVARRLKKLLKEALAHDHLSRKASAEEAHELRRLIRRGRYWAEFAAPAFDPFMHTLAQRFKAPADALGDVHDMDVFAARIEEDRAPAAGRLKKAVCDLRRGYWRDFRKAWDKLADSPFSKRAARELAAAGGE